MPSRSCSPASGSTTARSIRSPSSPGQERALSGSDDVSISVWDLATGRLLRRFEGHQARVVGLSVSQNGRWAASAGWDRTARVWDLAALTPDGGNRAGPTLYRIFGRHVGSPPGYPYSDAFRRRDLIWTEETVSQLFELGPDEFTPGSKMPLQKMTNAAPRDALIAFLKAATAPSPVDADTPLGQGSKLEGGSR